MAASEKQAFQHDSDDVLQLRNMAREFTEGFNSGDVDRIMRFYGASYVDVNLRNPVQTREERRKYYLSVMKKRGIKILVHPDEILVEGKLAFVRGTIDIIAPDQSRTELRYLEIARKQGDGSWVVELGMDGPVQEYVPEK